MSFFRVFENKGKRTNFDLLVGDVRVNIAHMPIEVSSLVALEVDRFLRCKLLDRNHQKRFPTSEANVLDNPTLLPRIRREKDALH